MYILVKAVIQKQSFIDSDDHLDK